MQEYRTQRYALSERLVMLDVYSCNCNVILCAAGMFEGETYTMLLITAAVLMATLESVDGARILLASPQISSHVMMQITTGEELARRGHEVYIAIASRYPKPESLKQLGLRTITYHIPPDQPFGLSDETEILLAERLFSGNFQQSSLSNDTSTLVSRDCLNMLSDQKFMQEVRALKFDIALVEPFIINPCYLLLPHVLNIRFVSLELYYLPWFIRMPSLPSFVRFPGIITTESEPTFLNSLINMMFYFAGHWKVSTMWNSTLLHGYTSLTWNELILKSELFLFIGDHHLDSPLPLFPNVISVPGLTVRPVKPLPDKLEKLAAQSRDGMILATFGSVAAYFPKEVVVKFLQAFSRVKQTVIARVTIPEGVAVPANVHVLKWLPQNDILSHQHMKLLITHCGCHSQDEALYHGVPMLGFPLFAEQPYNCKRALAKGFGLTMNIHNFTAEELFDNIQEMLNNRTYSDNIKRSSAILRDEPLIGPNKAAHWIEHVVKYGSSHLRSPAMDLPLYRFLMLDVLAIIFITALVVLTITCLCVIFITRLIWRKLFYKPSKKKSQ